MSGDHLNMDEWIESGDWTHEPLKYADVLSQVTSLIQSNRWFPREWQPAVPGEPVHEGGVIERKARFLYIYRCQRHNAVNPYVLAEQSRKVFFSAKAAARFYLKWDLHLLGNLNG